MPFVLGIRYSTVSARARRRPRIDLLDASTIHQRVHLRDCDRYLHVNNGRYLSLMDLGRFDFVTRCGFADAMRSRGWKPVAAGATIRFRRDLPYRSRYSLTTRIAGWDDDWWFFEQRFERSDGSLSAQSFIKVAILGENGRRLPTARVLEAMGEERDSPRLPDDLRTWQQTAYG